MFIVTAKVEAWEEDFPGSRVKWVVGQSREVHDSLVDKFRNNPAAWTVSGGSDSSPMRVTKTVTGGISLSVGDMVVIDTTAYLWDDRPAASSNTSRVIRITDVGPAGAGSHWVSDGTYWRPVNGSIVLQKQSGSIATPLAAVTGVTSSMLVPSKSRIIPAGMLIPGDAQLKIEAMFRRTGANATATLNVHLGTNKTSGDNTCYAFSYAATNLLDIFAAPTVDVAEAQRFTYSGWQVQGGSGNASTFGDKTTAFNTATEMGVSFSISGANAADSFALIGYRVTLCQ